MELGLKWQYMSMAGGMCVCVCVCGPLVHNPCYPEFREMSGSWRRFNQVRVASKNTKIKYESIRHSIIANGMQMGLGPSRLNQELGQSP